MGWFMQKHDIYVGSILDDLNVRFAPSQGAQQLFGGVEEMAALQKEFNIFKEGRTFRSCVALLNIGARNNEAKKGWLDYLVSLQKHPSNKRGQTADVAIVRALKKNLESKSPLPVHFVSHELQASKMVKVTEKTRPLHYLDQDFLVISFPMQTVAAAEAAMKAKAAVPAGAGTKAKAKKK